MDKHGQGEAHAIAAPEPQIDDMREERAQRIAVANKKLKKAINRRMTVEKVLLEKTKIFESFFAATITPMVFLDRNFNFIKVNEAYAKACERDIDGFPGRNHFEMYPSADNQAIFERVVATKTLYRAIAKPFVFPDHPEWGETYWNWTLTPLLDDEKEVEFLVFSLEDVTERKEAERQVAFTNMLLKLFSENSTRTEYLDKVIEQIRAWCDCACVGIRVLNDSGYIPYESYVGFSREFWESECFLSVAQDRCACTRVILGKPETQEFQCFTDGGSFYCNDTVALVNGLSEEDKKAYRGICIEHGYRSVAVIPVPDGGEIVGAVHIADCLDGRVPLKVVKFLEATTPLIGEALRRFSIADALRLANQYNRGLIEASLDPLVTINPDGKISDVNSSTEMITGFNREQLIGTDFSEYFTEPEKARAGYQLVFEEGFVKDYELEILHKGGHTTPVLYNASIYRDGHGEVRGVFAAARDITQHKKDEEERFRLIRAIEQIEESIIISDKDWRIQYVNPAFSALTGRGYESVKGQDIISATDVPVGSHFNADMKKGPENGETWKGNVAIRRKDGALREAEVAVLPVADIHGQIVNHVAVLHDVTEKLTFERHLNQAQKMQAIGTLAGGIAHDFNNIIAGIVGFTEMCIEDISPEDPAHRRLELILKGAYRGRDLVRQILTFSRKKAQARKRVAMNSVLNEVFPLIRASLPATIEIRTKMLTESATVSADPTQIHQVILNLCTNAADAMREKGGVLEITLAEEYAGFDEFSLHEGLKPGPYAMVSVSDTGHGMKTEVIERIFEPFFTTKSPGEGTGLGLSVVHGIVKGHDGAIRATSMPGKGSVFNIYIPISDEGAESDAKSIEGNVLGGRESILLVDDEDLLVNMSKERLVRLGYTVTGITNSVEALEIFRREPDKFDLVITDYTMPHMTGLELTRELLAIRPDTVVVMWSGLNDPVPLEMVKEAGVREFFSKPIGNREFAGIIRRVLD